MKKIGILIGLICCVLMLTGCNKELKTMTCRRTATQSDMKIDLEYIAEYRGDYVTKVESTEIIETENADTLELYKTEVEKTYSVYDDINHYDYSVKIEDNKLISTATINYEKIDTDKLIEIDSANGNFIKDGKIHIEDLVTIYESIGVTCDK